MKSAEPKDSGPRSTTAAIESKLTRKVLLIEDDGKLAEEIAAGLADQGFKVEWAPNGPEGLEMAHALKPDALIVDRQLPGLDGLGVIGHLRKDQIQVPVLVLSGLHAVEDRVRVLRAGGDDYGKLLFVCVVAHESEVSSMGDWLKRQTFAASPAEPGDLPWGLGGGFEFNSVQLRSGCGESVTAALPTIRDEAHAGEAEGGCGLPWSGQRKRLG